MFFVCFLFSEMASQKWIVLFAFLRLFIFMVEIRSSSACLEEVSLRLENTITALDICENDTISGKSPNCPVKAKRGRDEERFHKGLHRKGLLFLHSPAIHTQACKYQELLSQLLPATQNRIISRFRI